MPVCSSPKKPWKSNTHPNKWIPGDRWHMMTDQNSLSANHLTNQVFFLSKTTKVLPPESTNGQHFQASRLAMFDQQGFLMFQQPLVVSKSALSTLIKHFNSNNLKPYSFQKGQHSKMFQTNKGNQRICRNVLCDDAWCLIVLRISAGHSPKSESILVKSCSNIALWTSRALHVTDCSCRLARTSDFHIPILEAIMPWFDFEKVLAGKIGIIGIEFGSHPYLKPRDTDGKSHLTDSLFLPCWTRIWNLDQLLKGPFFAASSSASSNASMISESENTSGAVWAGWGEQVAC